MKALRKISVYVLIAVAVAAAVAALSYAVNSVTANAGEIDMSPAIVTQEEASAGDAAAAEAEAAEDSKGMKAIAAAIAIGLAAAAGAIGMGIAIAKSSEGIARQPEAEGKIRTNLMLGLVFIETAIIFSLIVSILVIFVL